MEEKAVQKSEIEAESNNKNAPTENAEPLFVNETDEQTENKKKDSGKKPNKFVKRAKDLWNYFTLYEKIWYVSILVIAIVFAFIFPEDDTPTQLLQLDNSVFADVDGTFTTLDFSGTDGEFVIDTIYIDNNDGEGEKEYCLIDYTGEFYDKAYAEHTVDPAYPETLALKLPVAVNKNSKIRIECYEDSDGGKLALAITDGKGATLFSQTISFEESEGQGFKITSNSFLVSAAVITFLYLMDVILNITCELLISKQSKWNFVVSLGVEIVEIIVCVVCMYRFATMVTTLLFWIPCDIISFVMWHRHPDRQKEELTVVKKLTWWQDILIVAGIAVWTVGVGYLLTLLEVDGGIFANNVAYKNVACYLDACASAVGIVNGVLILLRYREQWIAWYICAIIETVINIMAGQWILLVLKVGYLTNTTYGYIMWTRYIRSRKAETASPIGQA
ncbi:MAG: nicotinamide riboside transporter PnuC [Corallococcus sp.]|nr:nicotinamide riboside transporter PnuC [Corallococcus sp.]MCM1359974.1 nicotinamide riboside transporter PnuC [Corallococcus sp.]MCM1395531.1 nicotinamide riboside transporter PnuC [Corallococcus sp.]